MTKFIISFNVLLLSIWAFLTPNTTASIHPDAANMPMCYDGQASRFNILSAATFAPTTTVQTTYIDFDNDTTMAYSMPLLATTPKGEIMLSWTEKDAQGITSFCIAFSKDNGTTFGEKKTVYAGAGVSNSRLMRAKVLAKKDGSLVAVFANRTTAPGGNGGGGRGKGGRSSDIVYCTSTDEGATWSNPQSVDADPTTGIVRGFFDAAIMSNGEIAIVYLKDVANSTKHEERDLRLVITKNGVFQPEKVIDPVVCDCCNINLLTDANGALNVYYRDNNDDIRDMATMTSADNGATFSAPQIIHNDGWKISGCPHSGAVSCIAGKSALVAWYSGAETESGVRLATQEGKKHFVLTEASVKNPCLAASATASVMLWEQNQAETNIGQLVFRTIKTDHISETFTVDGSLNATNSTALVVGEQLLIAHEVKQNNKRNSLKIATTPLR